MEAKRGIAASAESDPSKGKAGSIPTNGSPGVEPPRG